MRWSGFPGGPGFSVFHFNDFGAGPTGWEPDATDAGNMVTKVDAFAEDLLSILPANTTLQVMGDVEAIDPTNGAMTDIFAVTQPAARTPGHSAGPYVSAAGAVITWRTSVVRNGRRVRGRNFIVPLIGAAFESNGSLTIAALGYLNGAATALSDDTGEGDLTVWARPSAPGATDGAPCFVEGYTVPDMGAILRSRRD